MGWGLLLARETSEAARSAFRGNPARLCCKKSFTMPAKMAEWKAHFPRRNDVSMTVVARPSPSQAAVFGLVLLAPAALFLLANMLNELGVGFLYAPVEALISEPHRQQVSNLLSPVVFLGGLTAALLLNALAIAQLDLRWEQNRLVSTVTIEPRISNVALIVTVGLMLGTFVGYAFVENYSIVSTHTG